MSHNGNAHAQAKQRLTHDLVRMQQQPVSASVRSHGAAGGGVGGANGAGSQLQQRAAAAAQVCVVEGIAVDVCAIHLHTDVCGGAVAV